MTSISRRRGRFDTALGGQDQFAELAGCAFTAARLCHPVGVLANETGSIGHSHAQADTPDDRQVWQIVTQISDLFVAQVQLAQQLVQNYQLVFATLIQVLYAEVFCPSLHHRCLASTDDSGDHARLISILMPWPSRVLKVLNSLPSSRKYRRPSVRTPSTSKIASLMFLPRCSRSVVIFTLLLRAKGRRG